VEVRYYLPEQCPQWLAMLAEKYRRSCARLWDKDEAMMVRAEEMTARSATWSLPRRERGADG
jgi:hypothetical protein